MPQLHGHFTFFLEGQITFNRHVQSLRRVSEILIHRGCEGL